MQLIMIIQAVLLVELLRTQDFFNFVNYLRHHESFQIEVNPII
jgi:hypothetical protein